ncbi:MAG: Gldg family protein, partial [Clostridia bacterium]|nr:Gldg family protein [Clostridia bacterium]
AFTISATAKSFFKKLDKDVTIYYVADPDMTYDGMYAAKFRVMLDKYARLSDHLKILYVDVSDEKFFADHGINAQNVSGSCLLVKSAERVDFISYDELFSYYFPQSQKLLSSAEFETVTNGWMNMKNSYAETYGEEIAIAYADQAVAQYYGITGFYDALTEFLAGNNLYWNADAMITASVDYVTTDDIPTTYILSGHGEAELSETFTKMYLDDLSVRYFLINLDQKGEIPANAVTLVLNAPKTDITDKEKALLADFIANGGSLVLNTTPDAMGLTNLMSLMNSYGLAGKDAIVLDDSLSYNSYIESGKESSTEKETDSETQAEPRAQEETTEGATEAETYPEDYLFILPDSKHELVASADQIIHIAMLSEIYSMYMAAQQQYQQNPQNQMYQAYANYYYQMYQSYSQTARNYQMLVVGAHPITYTETAGVTVKPIVTTSDKGYLSTDPTPAKHTMAVSATVTGGDKTGGIVWFGFADSYSKEVADEVYKYNYGFLYGAMDYAGSTQQYNSLYPKQIPAVDLGGSLDMPIALMLCIAVLGVLVLPLGTLITGIVICVKRKRK